MNTQNTSNDEENNSNFRNNANSRGDNSVRNNNITAADIPWALKARYIGTGYVLGVFTAPAIRRLISGLQPKLDQLLDSVTGQVEGFTEKSSDFLARAKGVIKTDSKTSCTDSCDDSKPKATPPHNA